MGSLKEILDKIILFLDGFLKSQNEELGELELGTAFSFKKRELSPFKTAIIAKVDGGKILSAGFSEENEKRLELKLCLKAYFGEKLSEETREKVFMKLIEGLTATENGFFIKEISREKESFDKETGAIVLPISFYMDLIFRRELPTQRVTDVVIKTK